MFIPALIVGERPEQDEPTFPYLLRFSCCSHSFCNLIPLFVDWAAGTAVGGLPGGHNGQSNR